MKLKRLPIEIKLSLSVIKKYLGTTSNNAAVSYCIAVASAALHDKIIKEEQLKQEKEKENVE
jgi:hypothetical protein